MKTIGYLVLLIMAAGCVDENLEGTEGCPPNPICTEVYITIPVSVRDGQGGPVSLDEYYTIRVETGEKIDLQHKDTESDSIRKANGIYPILTDNFVGKVPVNGSDFQFIGKKAGKTIVDETYKIGHDCCHIRRITGKDSVTVGD